MKGRKPLVIPDGGRGAFIPCRLTGRAGGSLSAWRQVLASLAVPRHQNMAPACHAALTWWVPMPGAAECLVMGCTKGTS
jgi:hypothetical protein